MKKRFGIAIIGGSGYGAGELLRMLAQHPEIEVAQIITRSHAGKPVAAVHSHLESICHLNFTDSVSGDWWQGYKGCAVVCAMPSGQAGPSIASILTNDALSSHKIVDLSGDFRLRDVATHSKHYPEVEFMPEIREQCVFGLPELGTAPISAARIITNPGCLATAALLALAPLRTLTLAAPVVIDGKTGTSGAGREPQASMHHPSRSADFTAYKVLEHRHEPEILQALGPEFGQRNSLMFVPHLIPIPRGIFVSAYVTLANEAVAASLPDLYREFYSKAHFVRPRSRPPRLVDVIGTNFCDLQIVVRNKQAVIMSAIDNLGKGMAGTCIQNLNLMFGLPEQCGLMLPSLGPA